MNEGEKFNFVTEAEQVCEFHDCENIVPVGTTKLMIGGPQIVCPFCRDWAMAHWINWKMNCHEHNRRRREKEES